MLTHEIAQSLSFKQKGRQNLAIYNQEQIRDLEIEVKEVHFENNKIIVVCDIYKYTKYGERKFQDTLELMKKGEALFISRSKYLFDFFENLIVMEKDKGEDLIILSDNIPRSYTILIFEDRYDKSDANQYLGVDLFSYPWSMHAFWRESDSKYYGFAVDENWARIIYGMFEDLFNSWVKAFGSFGSGNGKFCSPRGISGDLAGNLYVADGGNHRIVKLKYNFNTENLNFVQNFYSNLWFPYDVWNDHNGTPYDPSDDLIWVADHGNHRIVHFDYNGNFIDEYGEFGSDVGQFKYPVAIATSHIYAPPGGYFIYVIDSENKRIVQIKYLNGAFNWLREYHWTDANFVSIDIDFFGDVWVTDKKNHRIVKFTSELEPLCYFGTYGTGNEQFVNPIDFGFIRADWNSFVIEEWTNNTGGKLFSPGTDILNLQAAVTQEQTLVYISFILVERSYMWIKVYDQSNNLVRIINDDDYFNSVGEWIILWDRKDGNGQIVPSGTYRIEIKAKSGLNPSFVKTVNVNVTLQEIGLLPPGSPDAQAISESSAKVMWQDNSQGEQGFEIWRKEDGELDSIKVGEVGTDATYFIDKGLNWMETYHYRIRAFLNGYFSDFSERATVLVDALNPPLNIKSKQSSLNSIKLYWEDNSNRNTGYEFRHRIYGGNFQYDGRIFDPELEEFEFEGLVPEAKYNLQIRLFDDRGHYSLWKDTILFTAPDLPTYYPYYATPLSGIQKLITHNPCLTFGFEKH